MTIEGVQRRQAWAGPAAITCGVAAAWWHGLWPEPPIWVQITVPHHHRQLAAQPATQARRRDLQPADRVETNGLWVTAVLFTVLEAAVALGAAGSTLLDRAPQRRVTLADLATAHYRNCRPRADLRRPTHTTRRTGGLGPVSWIC